MTTKYAPVKPIMASELFDGRLEEYNVRETARGDATDTMRLLSDGRNSVWVYINNDGRITDIVGHGANDPTNILGAVSTTCDTHIASEYEPQFWGFDTEEEWERYQAVVEAREDLTRQGVIVDTGDRKQNPRTGRYEIVWALAGPSARLQ